MGSRRKWTLFATSLLVCTLLALPAMAKGKPGGKPGGGDPLPGTVYFAWSETAQTMTPEGASKTALPVGAVVASGAQTLPEPSHDLHGGHRWFLEVRSTVLEPGPGGIYGTNHKVFALRDDGNTAYTVQLVTDPDLEAFVGNPERPKPRWGPGDTQVSFIGRRWSGGSVVEGGIYVADIAFDANGDVTGLTAQPTGPAVPAALLTVNGIVGPDMSAHDWSPDSTQMVHNRLRSAGGVETELNVVHLASGAGTIFATTVASGSAVWSPDGSRIAYGDGYDIHTIAPDGSSDTRVVRQKGGRSPTQYGDPRWSPTGEHFICVGSGSVFGGRADIYRFTATGGGKSNLTADIDTTQPGSGASALAWR